MKLSSGRYKKPNNPDPEYLSSRFQNMKTHLNIRTVVGGLLALSAPLVPHSTYANEPGAGDQTETAASAAMTGNTVPNPSSTSNTTTINETQRGQEQISEVLVQANRLSLGDGL